MFVLTATEIHHAEKAFASDFSLTQENCDIGRPQILIKLAGGSYPIAKYYMLFGLEEQHFRGGRRHVGKYFMLLGIYKVEINCSSLNLVKILFFL